MEPQFGRPIEVFYSYSHRDGKLLGELKEHLASLKRQGIITDWHDRKIGAGSEWKNEINEQLDRASIILLLVSASFINSDYCYGVEVRRALERHNAGEARVIPVLLREVDWKGTLFGHLQALPSNGVAVNSWGDRDKAFADITEGVRRAAAEVSPGNNPCPPDRSARRPPAPKFVTRRDGEGRDLVERLTQELSPQENKSVTLWGVGGVGKTTLGFEVACHWEKVYGGRVVWSDAATHADYTLESLLDDVVKQLDQPEIKLPREEKARAAALLAAAPTLVVLDSYEMISPGSQPFINDWLSPAKCVVLFISRAKVDDSLKNITVPPMTPDESEQLLKMWVEETEDKQIFTREICLGIAETAEGIPYLMGWVFGQIEAGDVPKDVFMDLKQGKGDAAQRVFDRSFNLPQLGDDGRITLLALSLFRPSATREALAAVAGFGGDDDGLQRAIEKLRRLKLIKGEEQNLRLRAEGLTLSMAAARLPKSKYAVEIWQRFVAYFRDFTLKFIEKNPDRVETEKSNILTAMRLAPNIKDWDTVVKLYDLTLDIIPHFDSFKAWVEAIKLSEEDGEWRIRVSSPPPIIIEIYHREKEQVLEHYEGIRRKLNLVKRWEKVVHSAAAFQLGVFSYDAGDCPRAKYFFGEAERLKREFNDEFGAALACNNLGVVIVKNNKKDWAAEAAVEFEKALNTFDPDGQSLKDKKGFEWLVKMAKVKLLSPFSSNKRGKRFAKVVRRNKRWLKRVERQRTQL